MTIHYGELTLRIEQPAWYNIFAYSSSPVSYIFLFENGEIYDHTQVSNMNFNYLHSYLFPVPNYFNKTVEKKNNKTYFNLSSTAKLDLSLFKSLFISYRNYTLSNTIESPFNSIYYCHYNSKNELVNLQIFGIVRIKSTDQLPRYQFAYDSNEFTKEEIIYLLYTIFNKSQIGLNSVG
jgi:hypothetical protein